MELADAKSRRALSPQFTLQTAAIKGKDLIGPYIVEGGCAPSKAEIWRVGGSGHVRPRQGTEIYSFGAPSPLDFFLNFLQWIFQLFLSRFSFSKKSPPKCGENCPISGRRKKRRILSRLWLSWLFWSRGVFSIFSALKPCDPSYHLQESPGPPGPQSQRVAKRVFQGVCKKVPEHTRMGFRARRARRLL